LKSGYDETNKDEMSKLHLVWK